MKRFSFRLESVLRVRRIQEEQVRARLLQANRDVQLATERVVTRQARYDSLDRPLGTMDHDALERSWFTLDAAAGAVRHAHDQRIDAEIRATEVRHEWVEAKQRTEVLERLRERAHDDWLVDVRRDEDRAVDDLVVARHRLQHPAHERAS
jgi:flagellar export protein FliJ